jgi:fructose-1-phosphate kinase PfkB-like protein
MNLRRHVINMASASMDSASSCDRSDLYPMNGNNIVVGLNGALQKRFILPSNHSLVPGNVHRATHVDFGVGGKGQDVAIALHCLLVPGRRLSNDDKTNDYDSDAAATTGSTSSNNIRLLQFIGTGSTGDIVHNLLKDRLGGKTMEFTVRSSSEMRTCTSIISADETTELVEPSGSITSDELEELFSVVSGNRNDRTAFGTNRSARSLCIMGSMPPGCPEDTYARIYAQTVGPNTVCVVDSLAGTGPLLQTISEMGQGNEKNVAAGPVLFKINASELCKMAGTSKSNSETGGITVSELTNAINGFLAKHSTAGNNNGSSTGIIGLAITDGKHDAYFFSIRNNGSQEEQASSSPSFTVFKLPVPNLNHGSSRTLYPIGAGGK